MYYLIKFKTQTLKNSLENALDESQIEIVAYVVVINIDDHRLSKIADAASSTFIISFSQAHFLLLLLP